MSTTAPTHELTKTGGGAVSIPAVEDRTRKQNRFLDKIRVTESGCWEWTASTFDTGYGQFRADGTMREAHRVAVEEFGGGVPDDLVVRHKCPERSVTCVCPAHLRVGTYRDNWLDAVEDGDIELRFRARDVREIRRRYHEDDVTQSELGEEWGVSQVLIGQIVRREVYRHVDDDLPENLAPGRGREGQLSDDDVRDIRERYRTEDVSYSDIAKDYPVGRKMIGAIVRGERYSDVN